MCAVGCTPALATYPKCEVPVLLSKVNRIGVAAPAPVRDTGTADILSASAGHFMSASQSTTQSGNVQTTTTTSVHRAAGSMSLTLEVHDRVPNAADVKDSDIQLDGVWTGDFLLYMVTYIQEETWVDPKGRKVWVR